eukprot:c11707_g1_i1 orf=273-2900(+)
MEPQSSFSDEHTEDSDPALKWFLHHSQSQEHEKIESFCVGVDKFWEGQWSSYMKDWAAFNRQGQVTDQTVIQSCDSPLASDSSSRESSFFSWNSENSCIAGRHVLQSPELLSSRFSGFSLFNSGINHLEAVSREGVSSEKVLIQEEQQEQFLSQDGDFLHRIKPSTCSGGSIGCSRHVDSNFDTAELIREGVSAVAYGHQTNTSKDCVDDGWESTSSDSQSWVSTSFDTHDKDNGMQLGRPCTDRECPLSTSSTQAGNTANHWHADELSSRQGHAMPSTVELKNCCTNLLGSHSHDTPKECEHTFHIQSYKEITSSSGNICRCDSLRLGSDGILCGVCNADALTHSSLTCTEKLHVATAHQPCRLRFESETYQMDLMQDFGPVADNCDASVHEGCMPDESFEQNGMQGLCEISEHAKHKPDKISQFNSVMVDTKAKLPSGGSCKHLQPTSPNTVISASLQSGNVKNLPSHIKSGYSVPVKDRFASSTLHGYLRFAEQGGSPCYSFFVDDSDEVLFARACEQEKRSNKENCDWTYTFHSKKDNGKAKGAWKGWSKREKVASDLVANMRVPSVGHYNMKGNQDGLAKEARFVLYDGRGPQHVESQAIGSNKIQAQPLKPVLDNMAASQTEHAKQRVEPYIMNPDANIGHVNIRPAGQAHSNSNTVKNGSIRTANAKTAPGSKDSGVGNLKPCHLQQAELAAIVISTSVKEKKITTRKESKSSHKDTAGWGIKFLDKGSESGWGLSFMEKLKPSSDARGLEEMPSCRVPDRGGQSKCIGAQTTGGPCLSNMVKLETNKGSHTMSPIDLAHKLGKTLSNRKKKLKIDVTVILPAGIHGLPSMQNEENVGFVGASHGPTPLLERWMSGGQCECGGWDMGC